MASRAVRHLQRITKESCSAAGAAAAAARARAAVAWAALSDSESAYGCTDCATLRPGNCHVFFWNAAADKGREKKTAARRLAENNRKLVEESLMSHLDKVCCARNPTRPSEPETCHRQHCGLLMQRTAVKRAAHSLRKLHERGHPALKTSMQPVHQMALDVVAPHLHPHAPCREKGTSVRQECMFRSFAHHISHKHGVEYSKIESALDTIGVDVSSAMKNGFEFWAGVGETHGDTRRPPPVQKSAEPRPNSERHRRRAQHDERRDAQPSDPLRAEPARTPGRARAGGISLERAGIVAGSLSNWSRGASAYMSRLHKISKTKQGLRAGNVDSETEHFSRGSALSDPRSLAALLGSDPGSLTGRILRATTKLGSVVHGAGAVARKLRSGSVVGPAWGRRRTEAGSHAPLRGAELQRALDDMFSRFVDPVRAGRRMQRESWPSEPEWHAKTGAWVASALDWRHVKHELHRFAAVDKQRMHWWTEDARKDRSSYPLSGYSALDVHVPPSTAGRLLRRLAYYVSGKEIAWESQPQRRRKLDEATTTPSRIYGSPFHGGNAARVAGGLTETVLDRALSTRRGVSRRLVETVFSGVLNTPYTAGDADTVWGGFSSKSNEAGYLEAVVRYVIYDVFLCYLYASDDLTSNTQLGGESKSALSDGTDVKTHHSQRACFPAGKSAHAHALLVCRFRSTRPLSHTTRKHALTTRSSVCTVPFIPKKTPSFRDITNTQGVNFSELSYRDTCITNTTVWGLDALAQIGANGTSPWSVMALVLRSTEAVDSVKNFAGSASADDGMHAAALLICGTMQLGCAASPCCTAPRVCICCTLTDWLAEQLNARPREQGRPLPGHARSRHRAAFGAGHAVRAPCVDRAGQRTAVEPQSASEWLRDGRAGGRVRRRERCS